jgi:hypothetical protein
MVIREKVLIRELKEAYKGGGYVVITRPGGRMVFLTFGWTVEIDKEDLPREILALLALHMGYIPEESKAYRIMKGKDEPMVQTMLYDTAINTIHILEESVQQAVQLVPVSVRKTVLTIDGFNLWQKLGNNGCLMVNPHYENLIRILDDVIIVGDHLYKEGGISKVYIRREENPRYENQLNHLGQIPWVAK